MLFAGVVGQQTAKNNLIQMWRQNHLPHALLVCGLPGTGSLPLALALAQFIFCSNKQAADACGECPDCRKVAKMEHADLHFSFPTIPPKAGTKAMSRHFIRPFREFVHQTPYGSTYDWLQFIEAENKQGNITAEECREIIETLNLKSYEGGKKILIMWRPEYLGKEGNILLKMIEEPPADTVIIFAAEDTESILPTILSRTQMVKLPPLAATDIARALVQEGQADDKKAGQIALMAHGSYTEALRLVKDMENDLFPETRNWFNSLFTNNGIALSRFAEDLSKQGREQQKNFLQYVVLLLEATIRCRYTGQANLAPDEAAFVQKLAATKVPFETFNSMIGAITRTAYYIERNAHARTQIHALCIKLVYAIQNKEVTSLVN
jgi:DNA polymerase-3 subunit delta'